jgi:polysaccharide biosynthesis transport protein
MNKLWDETSMQPAFLAAMEHNPSAIRTGNPQPADDSLRFRELANILRRRSRRILVPAFCGATLVFVIALLLPPQYTAKVQIAIDPPSSGAQASAELKDEGVIETHIATLLSHDHLQRVVDSLLQDPKLQVPAPAVQQTDPKAPADPEPADRVPLRIAPAGWIPTPSDLVRRLQLWTHLGSKRSSTALSVEQLERYLTVRQEGRSRVITVTYTAMDPDAAATIANRIVERYVQGQSEQKRAYIGSELARLGSRIADLKVDVEKSGGAVQAFMQQGTEAAKVGSASGQHLLELERQAVAKGQLYHTLLRRQQEIRDQQETASPDSYILSFAATPNRPSSPNPFLYIFPTLIVFLIGGSMLAVFRERLDRGLRSDREINEALGVACAGLVPLAAKTRGRRPHEHLLAAPFAAYAEAFRSIAATTQLTSPLRQPSVILITSSLPEEGKTTVAISLSLCLALLRRRVLLIDLDFKHPSVLRELGGKADHGVLDLVLDSHVPTRVIQHSPKLGFDYLPMNRCNIDPLPLLAGEEMPRLLNQLRLTYDCIIIDSSPLLGNAETRLLAPLADEILFLVKWGSTRRELAQTAISLLRGRRGLPTNHPMAVTALIAQVDLKEHARYGYGDAGEFFLEYRKHLSSSATSSPRPRIPSVPSAPSRSFRTARIFAPFSRTWSRFGRRRPKPAAAADR